MWRNPCLFMVFSLLSKTYPQIFSQISPILMVSFKLLFFWHISKFSKSAWKSLSCFFVHLYHLNYHANPFMDFCKTRNWSSSLVFWSGNIIKAPSQTFNFYYQHIPHATWKMNCIHLAVNLICPFSDEMKMTKISAMVTSRWRHEVTVTWESQCNEIKKSLLFTVLAVSIYDHCDDKAK